MADPPDDDGTETAEPKEPEGPKPGQMSELLKRLARSDASSGAAWNARLFPGAVVDRFELVRQLGRGGFGEVWEAIDRRIGRRVAFKAMRAGDGVAVGQESLQLEAENAARLSHPNIVTLLEPGLDAAGPYLILELLEGRTLADRLEDGTVPLGEALRILIEVARGVSHAHHRGVVHRDLKPANVFLCDDGRVKVLDLGLAHALGHVQPRGGTRGYMAPEQARGMDEDQRTDVFAMGVILFRMLSGKLPFADEAALLGSGAAPRLVLDDAPEVAELVAHLVQKDPVRRPREAGEALRALERIERAYVPELPRPVRVRHRPLLRLAALMGIGVVLGVVVAYLWITVGPGRKASPKPAETPFVLAIADIANETGDPDLGELTRLKRTVIEQSPRVSVLPRARLVDLVGSEEGAPVSLDEATASDAARRAGADALVIPRILSFGNTFVMEVRAVQPTTGAQIFAFLERATGKDAVPSLLERACARLRVELGETEGDVVSHAFPVAKFTPVMVAAGLYERGMTCFERNSFAGSFQECVADLEKALERDPGFALAALDLSLMQFLQGAPRAAQRAALERARSNPDRVPRSVRIRLDGWSAYLDGEEVKAKSLLRKAAEASPEDKYGWYLAAEIPFHRDEFREALPLFRRVRDLAPRWVASTAHLVIALGATGDASGLATLAGQLEAGGDDPSSLIPLCFARLWIQPDRALEACNRARSQGKGKPVFMGDEFLAIALLNLGERARLDTQLRGMGSDDQGTFGWYMALWLRAQEGRWSEVARAASAADASHGADPWFLATYAEMIAGAGDLGAARRAATRVAQLEPVLASGLAVQLAYAGDLEGAEDLARFIPPDSPRRLVYDAVVRWRRGDAAGAVEPLRKVASQALTSSDPPIPPPILLLGEALADAGRHGEAVEALRRFVSLPMTYPSWLKPRALLRLAQSLDRLGDQAGARDPLRSLLGLWKSADASQPSLAEARELAARLDVH